MNHYYNRCLRRKKLAQFYSVKKNVRPVPPRAERACQGKGRARSAILAACIVMAAPALASCGSIQENGGAIRKIIDDFEGEPVVPRGANRIYIAPPANTTGMTELSPRLLDMIRRSLSLDGRLGVDSDDARSDLRLDIRISHYRIEGVRFDELGRAVLKRMRITADVRLINLRRKKQIFYEADIQAFRNFSDLDLPIETEEKIREYVLDDLAKRITAKTVTGWYTDLMTPIERGK